MSIQRDLLPEGTCPQAEALSNDPDCLSKCPEALAKCGTYSPTYCSDQICAHIKTEVPSSHKKAVNACKSFRCLSGVGDCCHTKCKKDLECTHYCVNHLTTDCPPGPDLIPGTDIPVPQQPVEPSPIPPSITITTDTKKKSNTLLWILLSVMILLMIIMSSVGLYLYVSNHNKLVVKNKFIGL